jgi:rifampicin phosphotransferase
VQAHVLREKADIFSLTFQSSSTSCARGRWMGAHRQRRDAFESYQRLTPPRVLTSDGEGVVGLYRREDLLAGWLVR